MFFIKLANYLFSAPMPFISLVIPFIASMLIFIQRIYRRLVVLEEGLIAKNERGIINFLLFGIFLLNFFLTLMILSHVRTGGTSYYILSSSGWVRTLIGENQRIHALIQVDTLGAFSAAVTAFISLGSILSTLIDKEKQLSPTKAGFFLLTLCGVQGVFYSDGLIAMAIFLFITQVGIIGLYKAIPSNSKEFIDSIWYYSSRFLLIIMFFIASFFFYKVFKTDNVALLSSLITGNRSELYAFIFLLVPTFFMFINHFPYVEDVTSRTFFRMMSQASFFIIIRVVFLLYGPTPGLDKIPVLFIFLGLIDIFLVIVVMGRSFNPTEFTQNMEQYLKALMLIMLSVAMEGVFSADKLVRYGFIAMDGMLSTWILYLPFSAILSIISINLKKKYNNIELWQYGGLFNIIPIHTAAFFLSICVMAGLPPFVGFATKQFLYRAAFNYNPILMLFLFISLLIMLIYSLRFFVHIFISRRILINNEKYKTPIAIKIYLSMLLLFFMFATFYPGIFFNKYLSPSVDSLLANKEVFRLLNRDGEE